MRALMSPSLIRAPTGLRAPPVCGIAAPGGLGAGEAVAAGARAGSATGGLFVVTADRKSVVSGKSVSVRVDLGGRRIIQKKHEYARMHSLQNRHSDKILLTTLTPTLP